MSSSTPLIAGLAAGAVGILTRSEIAAMAVLFALFGIAEAWHRRQSRTAWLRAALGWVAGFAFYAIARSIWSG